MLCLPVKIELAKKHHAALWEVKIWHLIADKYFDKLDQLVFSLMF